MSVYIAAPFDTQDEMKVLRGRLQNRGHLVTSRWLDESEIPGHPDPHDNVYKGHALRDLQDIRASTVVILFNPLSHKSQGTGGRHVETGFALGVGKSIIIYGWPSNVFHALPHILVATTFNHLIDILTDLDHP